MLTFLKTRSSYNLLKNVLIITCIKCVSAILGSCERHIPFLAHIARTDNQKCITQPAMFAYLMTEQVVTHPAVIKTTVVHECSANFGM